MLLDPCCFSFCAFKLLQQVLYLQHYQKIAVFFFSYIWFSNTGEIIKDVLVCRGTPFLRELHAAVESSYAVSESYNCHKKLYIYGKSVLLTLYTYTQSLLTKLHIILLLQRTKLAKQVTLPDCTRIWLKVTRYSFN